MPGRFDPKLQLFTALAFVSVGCEGVVEPVEPGFAIDGTPDLDREPERATAETAEPLAPLIRRLTKAEYGNSVLDLFGLPLTVAELERLPDERALAGFERVAVALSVDAPHVEGFFDNAASLSQRIDLDALVESWSGCNLSASDCVDAFIDEAALRIFRRPWVVSAEGDGPSERDVYSGLVPELEADGATRDESVRRVLQAMLQSPQFLYLLATEPTAGVRTLDSFELASRLSYFLWAGPPDEELLLAASTDELSTDAALQAQVERMWNDREKVERSLGGYLGEWASVVSADVEPERRNELRASLRSFYLDHLLSDGSIFRLLDDPSVHLTGSMAADYGLEPVSDELQAYPVDQDAMPVGLLAQPGVIAGMSPGGTARITDRGLFLVGRVLCEEVPELPDSISDSVDSFTGDVPEDATPREISELRMADAACGNCHGTFDPMAYPFESFDGAGRRVEDPGPVDGWIPPPYALADSVTVSDLGGLTRELAQMEQVQDCLVRNHLTFALAASFEHREAHVSYLTDTALSSGGSALELVKAIVSSNLFREVAAP
ncbi:MAG: DUF1592 domain-containing protein [Myxococcota bacterium]